MRQFALIRTTTRSLAAMAILGAAAWSCSPASEGEPLGAGATAGKSAPSGGTRPELELGVGGGSTSGGQAGGAVCKAQVRDGQRVPVDMYFLVDSSGSMGESVAGGSKWEVASAALVGFLNDPRNTGMGVGIGYFPGDAPGACTVGDPNCFCIPFINICFSTEGGSCQVSDYATPAVPLALPPPLPAVVNDITQHAIGGGTPTRPALEGALQYLSGWVTAHPDRKPVLVLATDGEPSGCATNTPQDVADVAAAALAGPHAIRTFVIGVGNSLSSLNLVAQAGGTDRAFLVDTGGDVAREFADALDQIRGAASACDFSIPDTGEDGEPINPSQVNVSYVPSGSSSPTLVPQTFMGDPSNCDSTGGWYYDNPQSPTAIKLCDATCRALSGSTIQVEFGCDTVVRPPH
jgi:hypothetical protein